jgi:hypothetical protein
VEGDERRGGAESSGTYYSGFMSNRGWIAGPPPALLRAPSPPAGSGRSRGGWGRDGEVASDAVRLGTGKFWGWAEQGVPCGGQIMELPLYTCSAARGLA